MRRQGILIFLVILFGFLCVGAYCCKHQHTRVINANKYKKIFFWGLGCAKRGIVLLIPMLFVAMTLIDVLTMADSNYPNNTSVFIFGVLGILFYISCLYCILVPLNKWNKLLFVISCCFFIGMYKLSPDIRKISQHSQCIEVYSVPCPDGIVLGGG